MKKYFVYIIVFFLLSPFASYSSNSVLTVSYGSHNAEPYAIIKDGHLSSGIIKDLFDEIVKELNIKVRYVEVPKKREEHYIENNKVHALSIMNPKWLKNSKKLQWSDALFSEKDILVTLTSNTRKISNIDDLTGMRLGTIRGYIYPALTPYFDNKKIFRSDVRSMKANFSRLKFDIIDALVDADILINYHLKSITQSDQFQKESYIVSQHYVYTALSPNSPVSVVKFNQALEKLKERGAIKAILQKYGYFAKD